MALVPIKTASETSYCDCIHGCYELASLRDEDTGKGYCPECAKEHLELNQGRGTGPAGSFQVACQHFSFFRHPTYPGGGRSPRPPALATRQEHLRVNEIKRGARAGPPSMVGFCQPLSSTPTGPCGCCER